VAADLAAGGTQQQQQQQQQAGGAHEAGFDAFMTGVVFVGLLRLHEIAGGCVFSIPGKWIYQLRRGGGSSCHWGGGCALLCLWGCCDCLKLQVGGQGVGQRQ
jgi:hypothetical protein